jgi:glycosyltransferase involved in cell wall biosynthesis
MHIALFVSWYKTPENPMYGTFFEEQARALQAAGNKVGVFYPSYYNYSNSYKPQKPSSTNDNGLPTYRIEYKAALPKLTVINYYIFCKNALKHFEKYINTHGRPDVIHAHSCFFGGLVARYISKKTGIPYILTKHYTDIIQRKGFFVVDVAMSKHIIQKASAVVAVSSGYAQNLADFFGIPSTTFGVIPNMVNDIFVQAPIADKPLKTDKFNFLTVSFIDARKNHTLMLHAFAKFAQQHPQATFTIAGDGDMLPQMRTLADVLGVGQQVFFVGLADRAQVLGYMQQANCFLLASKYESFGVVLIEALAMGLPLISTDSTGPKDIINATNGIITPDFSADSFAVAMERIYEDYEKYPAYALRHECQQKFGASAIVQQLMEIYVAVKKVE